MANRFHNKFHKYNHHTEKQDNIPDAGYDPIASHESPFLGDFVISPFEDAVLSAKLLNVERISTWGDDGIVIETSGAAMSLDESVISAHSDSISAYFDDTALLRGLSGQLLIEPRFSVLSGLDISELKTRTGSFELRDTIATLWNNDGLKVNNFAGLYFTHEKGEYLDNDWRIKSFVDINNSAENGIDFSYFDGFGWVPEMDIRRDGVSATHWFGKSANIDVIYASEQVSATSGFFVTLSAGSIIGGEKDPMAMRVYHYGSPDIVESPAEWFEFDPGTGTITSFNYEAGRENVVIPWEIGGVAVEAIGAKAFSPDMAGCPVTNVVAGRSVLSIEERAFNNCGSLTSVTLPVATSIGGGAFNYCTKLTSVTLPAATGIGEQAFSYCSLLTSVNLPAAINIEEFAFSYCSLLTSVNLPAATSIGGGAFQSCYSLTSVNLPAATSIGGGAFQSCNSLTSVTLPVATSIGYGAFGDCTSLASVTFPAATYIGGYAFYSCGSLTSVTLPVATSIGDSAFGDCTSLTSIYFGGNAPTAGTNVFYGVPANQVTIYVLDGTTGWGTSWGGMPVVQVEDFGLIDTEIFAKSVKIQDSLIIKDTADGNYYRIQITNGILNTELVSGV